MSQPSTVVRRDDTYRIQTVQAWPEGPLLRIFLCSRLATRTLCGRRPREPRLTVSIERFGFRDTTSAPRASALISGVRGGVGRAHALQHNVFPCLAASFNRSTTLIINELARLISTDAVLVQRLT